MITYNDYLCAGGNIILHKCYESTMLKLTFNKCYEITMLLCQQSWSLECTGLWANAGDQVTFSTQQSLWDTLQYEYNSCWVVFMSELTNYIHRIICLALNWHFTNIWVCSSQIIELTLSWELDSDQLLVIMLHWEWC
jgi:hypothetical protein